MNRILIFGDSLAYGKWDMEGGWVNRLRQYIDHKYNNNGDGGWLVYNLGVPGDLAVSLVKRLKSELSYRIKKGDNNYILFAIGINDSCPNNRVLNRQVTEIEFKKAIEKLIEISIRMECKVCFIGLTPVNPSRSKGLNFDNKEVQKFDQYLSTICDQKQISKVNLFEELVSNNFDDLLVDSVHPNTQGHEILFQKILNQIQNNFLFNI